MGQIQEDNRTGFLRLSHLPEHRVTHCVIGENHPVLREFLTKEGISVIETQPEPLLESEVACHADMALFSLGADCFLSPTQQRTAGELRALGARIHFIRRAPFSPYPGDCGLNALVLENHLFGKQSALCEELKLAAASLLLLPTDTAQGYTKCSVSVVNQSAIITEDCGIARLLKKYQIDVLTVRPGAVTLSGTHTGFLGGASGKLSADTMYFHGNLSVHPDFERILQFLAYYHVQPIWNPNLPLTDVGGILPIKELQING